MKRDSTTGIANKIDVILSGQETIGSAERCCEPDKMRERFETISNGEYASLLVDKFGKDRVYNELDEFLSLDFIPRSGGGIGVTRLVRSMEMENLFPDDVMSPLFNEKKVDHDW